MAGEPRVAIVTGAGSGIGRATALRLAADGWRVVCADIDGAAAAAVAGELGDAGVAVAADLSREDGAAAVAEAAQSVGGGLGIVVANAGAMVEGGILSLSLEDWNRAMSGNATAAFQTARATLPQLVAAGGGALVFVASTVALRGMKGVAAYSAAKGAIAALTRQLAADFAEHGVRVNAVAPGAVRTPLSESQFRARAADEAEFEALLEQVIARYPLRRWGQPGEIAEVIHFLATDRSAWMTGQIVPVDGGLLSIR
jgi:NAD(P)-dependent dehydrogenase (short-subunit alcohol dehydrogenase family)